MPISFSTTAQAQAEKGPVNKPSAVSKPLKEGSPFTIRVTAHTEKSVAQQPRQEPGEKPKQDAPHDDKSPARPPRREHGKRLKQVSPIALMVIADDEKTPAKQPRKEHAKPARDVSPVCRRRSGDVTILRLT